MTKMKAAVHTFGQPLTIEEVEVPAVPAGQVLVKVVASGVCHTDLYAADGDWPVKPTLPFILGHDGVGFVAALGAGVKGIKEGDRVGTRKDLQEALEFAAEGKVYGTDTEDRLDNINVILGRLKAGQIDGRVVLRIAGEQ